MIPTRTLKTRPSSHFNQLPTSEIYSELAATIDETIEVLLQESCLCLRCHKQLPTPPPSPSSASFTSSSSSSHQDESRDGFSPSQYNLLSSSTTALNQTVDQWTQTNVSVPLVPSASTNRSRIPKLVTPKPPVNNPTTSRASKTAASETSNVITPQSSRHTVNRSAPLSRSASTPVVTAQRPKSVNLQQKSRRYLTSTPLHATPHLKPFHTSTPVNSPQMCSPSTTPKPNLSSSLHQSLVTSLHHSSKVSSRSTARKEQTRPKTSQSQAADARCIKRMLTGIASPSAPVECFASPELQEKKSTQNDTILNTTFDANNSSIIDVTNIEITNQSGDNEENESSSLNTTFTRSFSSRSTNDLSRKAVQATMSLNRSSSAASTILPKWRPAGTSTSPNSLPTMNSTICKNSEGTGCIPKPADLRVTRRVGVDGAVLAWSPLDHDCVLGFQVVVQGRVVQHVKSPHRTKALITGLPASNSYTIGLISVGVDGRCSTPAVVKCDRTTVYPGKNQKKTPLVRKLATPTCI